MEIKLTPLKEEAQRMNELRSSVVLQDVKGTTSGDTYGDMDILLATQDIFDIQAKLNTPLIVLGVLAEAVRFQKDKIVLKKDDYLEWGIRAKQFTPEVKSLFKTWGFVEESYGYSYTFSPPTKWDIKIPVKVRIIKKRWPFLDALDTGFFGADGFNIPNPWEKYWRCRHIIR